MELPFELLLRIAEADNEVYWKMCAAIPQLGRYMLEKRRQKRKQIPRLCGTEERVIYLFTPIEKRKYARIPPNLIGFTTIRPKICGAINEDVVFCAMRSVRDTIGFSVGSLFDISYFIDGVYIRVFGESNGRFKVYKRYEHVLTVELECGINMINICHLIVANYLYIDGRLLRRGLCVL